MLSFDEFLLKAQAIKPDVTERSYFYTLPYPQRSDFLLEILRKNGRKLDKELFNKIVNERCSIADAYIAIESAPRINPSRLLMSLRNGAIGC